MIDILIIVIIFKSTIKLYYIYYKYLIARF